MQNGRPRVERELNKYILVTTSNQCMTSSNQCMTSSNQCMTSSNQCMTPPAPVPVLIALVSTPTVIVSATAALPEDVGFDARWFDGS
jgi:hypothetical protein